MLLVVSTGCATIQPTVSRAPAISAAAPPPIPADKKLHWGWTVAVIVVVVLVIAAKQATDFDWKTGDGGTLGRPTQPR